MSESAPTAAETRRIAEVARDRVRFEEEALELSDQVFRVARRLAGSREEAEDLVQDTYARAFRSWQQYQPGHEPARLAAAHPHQPEHRPRPPRPAHARHPAARGRRLLPLQQARVVAPRREPRRGARDRAALAELGRRGARRGAARLPRRRSSSSTSASSPTPTPRRSSTSRSARSCRASIAAAASSSSGWPRRR